jgi:AcrR family transcriptional regulator
LNHPSPGERNKRPLRADAARNVQSLMAAARDAFAEHGAEASLDDIAKRAGVGPGTLYRHFPSRDALIEAVYREGVRSVCAIGDELSQTETPIDALVDWLRAFSQYACSKRGLSKSMLDTIDNREAVLRESMDMVQTTSKNLVDRAKAAGEIRADVDPLDLIKLAIAIGMAGERSPEGSILSDRLLLLSIDGLRSRTSN